MRLQPGVFHILAGRSVTVTTSGVRAVQVHGGEGKLTIEFER